jgi:hypothetical protein
MNKFSLVLQILMILDNKHKNQNKTIDE